MAKADIAELIADILKEFLPANGLELYKVEYVKEDGERYLRVYIEKPEPAPGEPEIYVGSDDCALVSEYLSAELDRLDPIEENYYLEVSSPGMDREFIRDDDYRRFAGRQIDITLKQAFEGRKAFTEVTLIGLETTEDGTKVLTFDETEIIPPPKKGMKPKIGETVRRSIPLQQVKTVRLSVIF